MLDEKDLQAIAQMMDTRMDSRFADFSEKMDSRFLDFAEMMDAKLAAQKKEILSESTHNMNLLFENLFTPRFNLLAEGQQDILDKLVPRTRVDDLEDEVKFLKSIVRQMNEDIQKLKKAN